MAAEGRETNRKQNALATPLHEIHRTDDHIVATLSEIKSKINLVKTLVESITEELTKLTLLIGYTSDTATPLRRESGSTQTPVSTPEPVFPVEYSGSRASDSPGQNLSTT